MPDNFSTTPIGGTVQDCPLRKAPPKHWIEIELLGEDDKPIPWVKFRAVLPGGNTIEGALDDKGYARIDQQPEAGACDITFPDLDTQSVEFLRSTTARP